ncbi:MAG: L-rhamnose isomerase [Clostridiales bacterium]|nr:L-rhamnose isomerase [Clostridiales bacterium]
MKQELIQKGFEYAKEVYAAQGVDVEKAMEQAAKFAISLHCWQGDDVIGLESEAGGTSGGIQTTGNYPGRARNGDELRQDFLKAISLIPGKKKLNLHASYAELHGRKADRDAYTKEDFADWMAFSKENKLPLDFNPTYFGHPYVADGFSLSSRDEKHRKFWIEHGKRCREIGEAFGKAQGESCVINFWMPDGYKDTPADTDTPRRLMREALDEIFEGTKNIGAPEVLDAVESKLFGIGVESYTVGSGEFMLGYALSRNKLLTLDTGHFHPTEQVSDKLSAVMQFLPKILLHISRPVRWDSDHVVSWDQETSRIFSEIIANGYENRVLCALDYFDASINRVAAWVIGVRNAQKAILSAYLTNHAKLRKAEVEGDFTARLALQEDYKALPFGPVWDMYCLKQGVPVENEWLDEIKQYEKDVLSKR